MRLPRFLKLSKVVAKDDMRPVLTCAFVREEEVEVIDHSRPPVMGKSQKKLEKHLIAYATNSYTFVRVDLGLPNLEDDGEGVNVGGPIPLPALQHMERGVHFTLGEDQIKAGITSYDRVISEYLAEKPSDEEGTPNFPDWHNLVPEFGKKTIKIGLNPRQLYELAQGMGMTRTDGIVLELDSEKLKPLERDGDARQVLSVMKVSIPSKPEAEGLIMPIRVNV